METRYIPSPEQEAREPEWNVAHLFPPRGLWTEDDYLSLPSNSRVELSEGCLELLPMPTQSHQLILGLLYRLLQQFVEASGAGLVLMAGIPVKLWNGKFRQPDIVFMRSENAARRQEQYWDGADLVVEVVSPGGRDRDTETKRAEYARSGIPEYWIVDPEQHRISVLVLREGESSYASVVEYGPGTAAASEVLSGFAAEVDAVMAAANS